MPIGADEDAQRAQMRQPQLVGNRSCMVFINQHERVVCFGECQGFALAASQPHMGVKFWESVGDCHRAPLHASQEGIGDVSVRIAAPQAGCNDFIVNRLWHDDSVVQRWQKT